MKYMLWMIDDGAESSGPDEIAELPEYRAWRDELAPRGVLAGGARLRPARYATSVRVRDGETLVSDGPFAETREQIGGYEIIACDDLDEAIEVAARHPSALWNSIEIRPFWLEEQ